MNYNKLFQLLIWKGICPLYRKFLVTLYTSQLFNVKWEDKFSDVFKVHNGVKQGGVLSPLLFGIYTDQLLLLMKKSNFGCYIGHVHYGSLAYTDDIVLMSPTILGTHKLLNIADRFGKELSTSFNSDKTKFLDLSKDTNRVNNITFNNNIIQTCSSVNYLGNWMGENSSDQNIEM